MGGSGRWTEQELASYKAAKAARRPKAVPTPAPAKRAKYKNRKTVVDGIRFDSMAEAAYYSKLKLWRQCEAVEWFCFQPVFDCGGGVTYRADFIVKWADGRTEVVDVKGFETREFLNKAKQVEAIHGVKVEVVKT